MLNKKMNLSIRSRSIQIIIIIAGISLIVNLSKDIMRLLRSGDELKLAEQKVIELEEERVLLKEKKEYYQSEEFVEEVARNKLNMSKEGETIVILPEDVQSILGTKNSQIPEFIPSWKQWVNLFWD